MEYLVEFQLHLFSLLMLILLVTYMVLESKVKPYSKILLYYIIACVSLGIIAEPLAFIFDGKFFPGAYFLEDFFNALILLSVAINIGFLVSYIDYYIYQDRKRLKQRYHYMHFTVFTGVMLIINIFYPVYYEINPVTHLYSPGKFLIIHYLLVIIFYFIILGVVYKHVHVLSRRAINVFVLVLALPLIGMFIQFMNVRLFFAGNFMALSVLAVYIFLESTTGEKDYLTRLYTRKAYEKYVRGLIESESGFRVLYIDLDNFKQYNDLYGHHMGDVVLKAFANGLQTVFDEETLIARLGGDEFIVVVESNRSIKPLINQLNEILHQSKDVVIDTISFSYGIQAYIEGLTIDTLYQKVDEKMYKFKREKRHFNRRVGDNKERNHDS